LGTGDFAGLLAATVLIGRGVYPPPCFWQKRLQALENKGSEREKERQERIRGGTPLKIKELTEIEHRKV
jgi:hypothetical protein